MVALGFGEVCFALAFFFVTNLDTRGGVFEGVAVATGLLLLPAGVAFGVFYLIKGFDGWIDGRLKRQLARHKKDGAYERAEFSKTRSWYASEDQWSAELDRRLKKLMDDWKEKH